MLIRFSTTIVLVYGLLLSTACTHSPDSVSVGMPYPDAMGVIDARGLERTYLSISVDGERANLDTFVIDENNYLIVVGMRDDADRWLVHSISHWEVGDPNVGKGHPDEFIETDLERWP